MRYVGITIGLLYKRLQRHLRYKGRDHRTAWIQSLLAAGLKPTIRAVEVVPLAERAEAEQRWIRLYRERGASLTNSTKGGHGCLGYRHTEEARAKMSMARRARPSNRKGQKVTAAERERMRQRSIRQMQDPGMREAVSLTHKGKTISETHRAAVGAAAKAKWEAWRANGQTVSEETRAKMREAARNRAPAPRHSDETRARLSALKRQWWAEKKAREATVT